MTTSTDAANERDAQLPDGYDRARDAAADLVRALGIAARESRNALLVLGADWCPDCRAFDELSRSPEVASVLRAGYVVLRVDVGRKDYNVDLASRYVDLSTSGIPALVVLSSEGTVVTATNDGSFANARAMTPADVAAFLTRWMSAS